MREQWEEVITPATANYRALSKLKFFGEEKRQNSDDQEYVYDDDWYSGTTASPNSTIGRAATAAMATTTVAARKGADRQTRPQEHESIRSLRLISRRLRMSREAAPTRQVPLLAEDLRPLPQPEA